MVPVLFTPDHIIIALNRCNSAFGNSSLLTTSSNPGRALGMCATRMGSAWLSCGDLIKVRRGVGLWRIGRAGVCTGLVNFLPTSETMLIDLTAHRSVSLHRHQARRLVRGTEAARPGRRGLRGEHQSITLARLAIPTSPPDIITSSRSFVTIRPPALTGPLLLPWRRRRACLGRRARLRRR